ncbi:MAG: tRNA (adenosine(37)-N6)-threonylcarbamoyltransferase complex ATPase subunit type 1 TsaE [Acidimicrobiales bacterium]
MIRAATRSADQTKALAAALAELARPGDLLLLAGDLGAGKTAFTQGYGAALGVAERITSPTFTLVNQHEGRLVLNHLDVYRIEQLAEVLDIGLPELLDEGGVTVIEWGDAIVPALPADFLLVQITLGDGDDDRTFELTTTGPRWSARTRALTAALAPWLLPTTEGVDPVPVAAARTDAPPAAPDADPDTDLDADAAEIDPEAGS